MQNSRYARGLLDLLPTAKRFGAAIGQFWRSDLPGALQTAERLLRWGQLRDDIRGRILGELTEGKTSVGFHGPELTPNACRCTTLGRRSP
jgi:hypothetical protein